MEADASGILDCLSAAFAAYCGCYSEQGFLDTVLTPETLKHRMKQMVIFVAVRQLLERAETELRARKCTHLTLDSTEPLKRAIRFYEHHGYRPSGKVGDFFGMPLYEYVKDLRA